MKLEQIEQFNELAKTGNINRAAKNLYMSQPNLSRSIKHLEEEIYSDSFRSPAHLLWQRILGIYPFRAVRA